jgi:hypothetical protein
VKAVLMLGAKRQDGTPYYPQTHFYKLPKDLLFIILQYVSTIGQSKATEETSESKPAIMQHESTDNKKRRRED